MKLLEDKINRLEPALAPELAWKQTTDISDLARLYSIIEQIPGWAVGNDAPTSRTVGQLLRADAEELALWAGDLGWDDLLKTAVRIPNADRARRVRLGAQLLKKLCARETSEQVDSNLSL